MNAGGPPATPSRVVLWWGRGDPEYSRNRILRRALLELGWDVVDFRPQISALADMSPALRSLQPDLVWVPCFRQRDVEAAARWARRRSIPVLFDPLISAYDKAVFERTKLTESSRAGRALLRRERQQFASADRIVADTDSHAAFFEQTLGVPPEHLSVIPVGADEDLFRPHPLPLQNDPPEVLFYGSFIALQDPRVIVEAARRYTGPPVQWTLLGAGPLLDECRDLAQGVASISFEPWLPYAALGERIAAAALLLGVFGTTPKAARVIPNKVYQGLACARAVVTRSAPAYPRTLLEAPDAGLVWVPAGEPSALAETVAGLMKEPEQLQRLGRAGRQTYEQHFGHGQVVGRLRRTLASLNLA